MDERLADIAHVRPLSWPGQSRLLRLAALGDAALEQWRRTWLDDCRTQAMPALCTVAHEVSETEDSVWQLLGAGGQADDEVWISGAPTPRQLLPLLLDMSGNGGRTIGPVALALAQEAREDLLKGLARAVGAEAGGDVADAGVGQMPPGRAWSGAVRLHLRLDAGMSLFLQFGTARMEALVPRATRSNDDALSPRVPLQQALAARIARLQLQLDTVEINLGQLQGLKVGDVLLIPHPLNRPLQLLTDDGVPVCSAYLGQVRGTKAVELTLDGDGSAA